MDNNQNNNTENNQSGYTNFNNYQQPAGNQSEEQQPQGAPLQNPYQQTQQPNQIPYQQSPYQPYAPVQTEEKNKSMVLGIIAIVLDCLSCCCSFFTSFIGAILGLVGVIRNKKSVVSWIGLILGVVITIGWVCYMIYILSNPELMRSILEESGLYSDEFINEYMQMFETIIMGFIG